MTIERIKQATKEYRQKAIEAILSHAGAEEREEHDKTNKTLQRKLNDAYQGSFTLVPIAGDGDCFFRALADQLVTRYPEKTLQIYSDLKLDPENTDFAMVLKKLAVGGLWNIGENDRAKTLSQQSVQAQAKDMTVLAVLLGIDIVPVSLDSTPQVNQVILSQSNEDPRPTVFLALSDGHYSSLRLQANIKIPESIQGIISSSIEMKSSPVSEAYYEAFLEMKDPSSLAQMGSMQSVYFSGAPQSASSHSGGGGGGGGAKVDSSQANAVSAVAAAAPASSQGGGGAAPVAKADELRLIVECPVLKNHVPDSYYHKSDRLEGVFALFDQMERLKKYFPDVERFTINSSFSFDREDNIKRSNIGFDDVMRELSYWADLDEDKPRESTIYSSAYDKLVEQVKAFTEQFRAVFSNEIDQLETNDQPDGESRLQAVTTSKSASRAPAGFFASPRSSDSTITKQEFLDKFYNIILLVETLVDKKLITFEVYECLTNVFNQVGPSDQFDLTVISKVQKIINEEVCRLLPQLTPHNSQGVQAIKNAVDNLGNPPERHPSPQP